MGARGRPGLGVQRRSQVLVLRLRPDEMAAVRAASGAAHVRMAPFVRGAALEAARSVTAGGALPKQPPTTASYALAEQQVLVRRELRRIGVNVNQAVAALNRSGRAPAGLQQDLAELQALIIDRVSG